MSKYKIKIFKEVLRDSSESHSDKYKYLGYAVYEGDKCRGEVEDTCPILLILIVKAILLLLKITRIENQCVQSKIGNNCMVCEYNIDDNFLNEINQGDFFEKFMAQTMEDFLNKALEGDIRLILEQFSGNIYLKKPMSYFFESLIQQT